jgi:single-strand DNA-binding protein
MAKSINQVILLGRLTRDPEERTTSSGKTVVNFSLAVDRAGKDDGADFFEITAWEKLGELVTQYLGKGRPCVVQGRLRQETWDDKDSGKKRSKISITATDITFLGSKSDEPVIDRSESQENLDADEYPDDDIVDKPIDLSEIPF